MLYKIGAIAGVVTAAVTLAAAAYHSGSQQQQPRLAYVNSAIIMEQAPGAAQAQATFDREMAQWRVQVQALADSLQEMLTEYERQQVALSPQMRQERQQDILQQRLAYNQRVQQLETQAQTRQAELLQPILDTISGVIGEVREEQGYAMIFDVAAGALVAADTTLDVTEEVVRRLSATAGGS